MTASCVPQAHAHTLTNCRRVISPCQRRTHSLDNTPYHPPHLSAMDNSNSGELYRLYFDPRSAPVVFRQPQFMTNTYKIALLGTRGVGKTAIFNRLCYDLFEEETAQLHDGVFYA